MQEKKNVLLFWKTRNTTFPILRTLAQMLLASVATSVPSETLFSASGYQLWDRRNRLSPENIEVITFIYRNEEGLK